jgi:hypothetical protein
MAASFKEKEEKRRGVTRQSVPGVPTESRKAWEAAGE